MSEVVEGKKEELLTLKQERFCVLYASDKEFFGNGVQSYIESYNPERKGTWYQSAMASSSRLLTNVKILVRINELFEARGLNDVFVDKQLELLLTQNADGKTKLGAIKEYNQLKSRIVKKVDLTSNGKSINDGSKRKGKNALRRLFGGGDTG